MFLTLIRRELLSNLMTLRFAAAVLMTLLLVVATTVVLIEDYKRRLASYNTSVKTHQQKLTEVKTYSESQPVVNRPPNPLSLFNMGADKRLGNEIWISYALVPTLWDARMSGSGNPLLNLFTSIDLAFLFEVVLSLIAIIFAHDAITGERERGTLRLVLANSISRGYLLLAKYMSILLCLLLPVLLSMLLALILLTTQPTLALSQHDFLRIAGFVFSSIAYLSVFCLIGLLISAMTGHTHTALMTSLFVWFFWVLVYPNITLNTLHPSGATRGQAENAAYTQIKQVWEAFDRDRKHFLATDAFTGEAPHFKIEFERGITYEYFHEDPSVLLYFYNDMMSIEGIHENSERNVRHAQKYYQYLIPLIMRTADRTWLIRKQGLMDTLIRQANRERTLLKLSPVGVYDAATQAWVGTDLNGIRDFFDTARAYRQILINYYFDKKAFESLQWFSADEGSVDWHTLPRFSFQRSEVAVSARRALSDMILLLMINGVLFTLIFLVFLKSEV